MRLLIRFATLLYPGAWRKRYGAELDALAEDAGAGWSDFVDILTGAFQMQIRSMSAWRFAALCGLAGLIVAGVYTWRAPVQFRSVATLEIPKAANQSPDEVRDNLERLVADALSQDSMRSLIQKYDLYPDERKRTAPDEVVRSMRRDIRVIYGQPLNGQNPAYRIEFAYPDTGKALAVVQELSVRLIGTSVGTEILSSSTGALSRAGLLLAGLLLGMAMGMTLVGVRRWPLVPLVGVSVAVLVLPATFLISDQYRATATVRVTNGGQVLKAVIGDRSYLESLIASSNLYPKERRTTPMPAIVDRLQKDLTVRTGPRDYYNLTFVYSDRFEARFVLQKLVARILEAKDARIIDAPSLPEAAFYPRRLNWVLAALFAGLALGVITVAVRRYRTPALAA